MPEGLEVDVAGVVADGLTQDQIHEPNDRRLPCHFHQVVGRELLGRWRRGGVSLKLAKQIIDGRVVLTVGLLDHRIDLRWITHHQTNLPAEDKREIFNYSTVEGIYRQ